MSESLCVETAKGPVGGKVVGSSKYPNAKQVYRFSSIPFAKPPVGDLRFERPQDAEPWSEVLDATRQVVSPMQDTSAWEQLKAYVVMDDLSKEENENVSEDCLYLNVYTNTVNNKANLPVLVWLYGGGLTMGGALGYNGQTICSMQDVVVVIPNYRVNVFGFFTAGKDTNWKGNMGFFDQLKAMEWVKHNIKVFGGNPDNVTLFGQSAGALSVGYHVMSPLSRGYFHRAISHSGTATMPISMIKTGYAKFRNFMLESLNITTTDPDEMVAALKKVSATEIMEAQTAAFMKCTMEPFGVSVDGDFVPEETLARINEPGSVAPVPYIVGCNNTEAYGVISGMIPEFESGSSEEGVIGFFKTILHWKSENNFAVHGSNLEDTIKLILEKYSKKYSVDDKQRWSKTAGEILGDIWFSVPSLLQANAHADAGHPTYFYYMTQTPTFCHSKDHIVSGDIRLKVDSCKCDHGDDLLFTFGIPYHSAKLTSDVKFTKDECKMSEQWMNYIVNFAKTGNPNTGDKDVPVEWPVYKPSEMSHLVAQVPFRVDKKFMKANHKLLSRVVFDMSD
ncbi:carboxylesterase 1C-like [Ciona intestinalis]